MMRSDASLKGKIKALAKGKKAPEAPRSSCKCTCSSIF